MMQTPIPQRQGSPAMRTLLLEAKGRLVLAANERLFVLDIPADRLETLHTPLHFVHQLDQLVANVGDVLTFTPELRGTVGEPRFELPGAPRGVSLDPRSGEITIDSRAVWDTYMADLNAGRRHERRLIDDVSSARMAYRALLGRDPGDAHPLAVHFRVVAHEDSDQRAEMSGYIILLGPAAPVITALAEQESHAPASEEELKLEMSTFRASWR